MKKKTDKISFIIDYFTVAQPDVKSELNFENAYQLLVATILAAQCTDKRVNIVTPPLFAAYPTPAALAKASEEEILQHVKSVSYPNSKAAHLAAMSRMLVSDFNGEVPHTMEELTKLPGVGRKTANVILAVAFGKPAMPVDTHVFRVANRIGLTKNSKNVLETEKVLTAHFPKDVLSTAHHWLILHGRYVCMARNPQCEKCGIRDICEFYRKLKKTDI
mgnify:CR=1 FL=1